jgi:uncharacterized membrane protein YkoI
MRIRKTLAAMMMVPLLAAVAVADEEKIPLSKVPKEVLAAAKKKFPDAKVLQVSKEKEGNDYVYEVALDNNGQKIDMSFKPDGTIIEIEKTIPFKTLPEAVIKTLKAKYPRATFPKAEEVTKGETVAYEVIVATADKKKFEVVLSPEGKIVKTEDKNKAKEDKD